MAIQAGLVGLPNVGKSTLFNALTKSSIPAQNYPFCTVDPHIAITYVPDERLDKLAKAFNSQKILPATVQFSDIAGLVKGAAKGEGLGNQFLSNIMNVDLLLHVVRCFEDNNVTHVHNAIDPIDDLEVIFSELMLKDLESIEKREEKLLTLMKTAKNKNLSSHQIKELENEKKLIEEIKPAFQRGDLKNVQSIAKKYNEEEVQTVPLLSSKNYLIIANMHEDDMQGQNYTGNSYYQTLIEKFGEKSVIPICAKIEDELAQLPEDERLEMLETLEMSRSGLNNIIKETYSKLGLITFFTIGPKEAHAWTIKKDTKIPQAAGEIHSDMERGFICSEIYNCDDLFELKSEVALKNAGKIRTEGKEYTTQDGDVVLIRFNV